MQLRGDCVDPIDTLLRGGLTYSLLGAPIFESGGVYVNSHLADTMVPFILGLHQYLVSNFGSRSKSGP